MSAEICPGCDGPKSRRAKLCRGCRQRANAIGERVWTETGVRAAPSTPRTPQQNTAYHAKLSDLAKLTGADKLDVKDNALRIATRMFRRPIESSTELTEIEMELLLGEIDKELRVAKAAAAAKEAAAAPA